MTVATWAKELANRLFVRGNVADLLFDAAAAQDDWRLFRDSWDDLPVDAFMAHGETFRLRRHSVFNVTGDGEIEQLAPRPYLQTSDINHLNGDVHRTYEQIRPDVVATDLFHELLTGVTAVLTELHGPDVWHHQCFQNRITTSPDQVGDPTPEGIHRDGVDYVVTLLVDRVNIQGGCSRLYQTATRGLIHEETLLDPGDMLLADDERTLHEATRVFRTDPDRPGHRDVFIDVITRGTCPR